MQKYDEMVETGVDWIGDIPLGWKIINTSRLFSFEKGKEAQRLTSEYIGLNEGQYPVYSGQTSNGGVIGKYREYEFDEAGCLLVTTVGAKAMTSRFISGRFSLSQNCLIMRPLTNAAIDARYYSYAVIPLFKKERSLIPDHMQPSMRMSDLSAYKLPLPTFRTQQKIADFLDQETAKIDNLIAKQERLLELLEEKRRATITHAVTRGLDPNVELKETNIPWLGKIPAHWNTKRVSAVYQRKSVRNFPNEELLSVYRDHGVIPKSSRDDNHNTESEDLSKYQLVEINDLVTNKMKTWQGSIAVSAVRGIVSPAYFIFRPYNNDMLPKFVHHLLRSDRYIAQYKSISKGIRPGQWDLDIDQFKIMKLTVPPLVEQQDIVNAIELNEKKTKVLKQKIQTQIKLLKERRTSLISHAVTGKIKV